MAKFRQADAVGHRPDLEDGRSGGGGQEPGGQICFCRGSRSAPQWRARKPPQTEPPPRYNALAMKALLTLELHRQGDPAKIKARYKELVKRHHPDANGGDHSSKRLREIIQAYNFLRANKLV